MSLALTPAPGSTYRVQLRGGGPGERFSFDELAAQADYLAALGVTHAYLSPILQAAPGSTHGYDVVDHATLSAELGGAAGFARLRAALDRHGLRAVADVVPNHMAVPLTPPAAGGNAAWWSVLREGPESPYAGWLDVDWELGGGRVLVPVLGRPLADCLAAGEIALDRTGPEPVVRYYDHAVPVRAGSAELGPKQGLPELLDRQFWRLAYWRTGDEELNYRRFFDVGVRVEDEEVFGATHDVLLRLVRDGALAGLRVDHPDGLADPRAYLRRLAAATGGAWVVVEKILEGEERLPGDWPCAGTTGYDAVRRIGGVFVDPAGVGPLTARYTGLTGAPGEFAAVVESAKREVLEGALHAEVRRLVEVLARVVAADVLLRDVTRRALREALVEMLVAVPVYRAYVVPGEESPPASVEVVERAAAAARARLPAHRHTAVDVVRDLVLGRPAGDGGRSGPGERSADRDEVVVRFQQTCGPVMAKGVEDTAFYRWARLVALNEVGGDPADAGTSVEQLHAWCAGAQRDRPDGLTALSTHDTKRSEDVRARLAVLSELPDQWGDALAGWRAASAAYRPDRLDTDTEYLLWQTLVGVWPLDGAPPGGDLGARLTAYLEKAVREAKRHTSWVEPDAAYEEAVRGFALAVLAHPAVVAGVAGFVDRVAPYARVNVLGQKLLQLTAPGVPDVYQGTELVSLALVDPDNRRPVDYAARRALLARLDSGERPKGLDAEKLLVTSRAVRLRREHPHWYDGRGAYEPLPVGSPHAVAFCRGGGAVTVVTRLGAGLARAGGWGESAVELPTGTWTDVLTGTAHAAGPAPLRDLLARLPVALLAAR